MVSALPAFFGPKFWMLKVAMRIVAGTGGSSAAGAGGSAGGEEGAGSGAGEAVGAGTSFGVRPPRWARRPR